MHRVAVLTAAALLAALGFALLPAVPAAAADCFWSNGVYKCRDRQGRIHIGRPKAETERLYRRQVPAQPYVPNSGGGMGGFTYGCTMTRCD